LNCAKETLLHAGFQGFEHLQLATFGMEEGQDAADVEAIAKVATAGRRIGRLNSSKKTKMRKVNCLMASVGAVLSIVGVREWLSVPVCGVAAAVLCCTVNKRCSMVGAVTTNVNGRLTNAVPRVADPARSACRSVK